MRYQISDTNAKSSPVQWVIALVLLAFAIIFWKSINAALKKLMSMTGLSTADTGGYTEHTSAWDINTYKSTGYSLSDSELNSLAEQINNAYGWFNDDEDAVYAAFNKLRVKGDVSKLNELFTSKYQKDLLMYLNSFMNAEELQPIVDKVNNLG